MNKSVTLIIKVTNTCNLGCRYCFIEPSVFHKTMKVELARQIVRTFLDSDYFEAVTFVWHGGEPLLRGRQFFEALLAEQRAKPTKVSYTNSIQTNATRLDDEMLNFLMTNRIHIGLSMDGPRMLNDATRQMRGKLELSAHEVTIDAARRIQLRGRSVGAIVVVHTGNVDHPEEIYWEFKRQGINMKLNPLAKSGLAVADGADMGISADAYGRFLVRMFDVWFDDAAPSISVEPFKAHIARALGVPGAVHDCHFARSCHHSFLGIAPDGDLYPCGMFQGEPVFKYGNINELAPEEIALTALFGRIEEREQRVVKSCARCAFLDLCYSGCMFHSLKNANRFEEKDYYCAGYKMYFEHLLRRIHADLSGAIRGPVIPSAVNKV